MSTLFNLVNLCIVRRHDFNSLVVTDDCRSGAFGTVLKANVLDTSNDQRLGTVVGVKILTRNKRQDVDYLWKQIYHEALMMSCLDHPNIVSLLGQTIQYRTAEPIIAGLIMPWFDNGSVSDYLHKNPKTWLERLCIVCDIANGLAYMHSLNIIHGDLNPSNVLIGNDGRSVICDFGLSRFENAHTGLTVSFSTLNVRRFSPELLLEDNVVHTKASDVWAFACTAYEIFTGREPHYQIRKYGERLKAIEEGQAPNWRNEEGILLTDISEELRDWINKRWSKDPAERGDMVSLAAELHNYASKIGIQTSNGVNTQREDDHSQSSMWKQIFGLCFMISFKRLFRFAMSPWMG